MNSSIDLEMFESMRYSDLQKLAKSYGIKANMKMDKLLKALKDHVADKANRNSSTKTAAEPTSKQEPSSANESEPEHSDNLPRRGRKPKVLKRKQISKEKVESRETSPQPIPPIKFFATPKGNTPTAKRFPIASRTPALTSGIKRLSQITPRGLKAKANTPCTPSSLQKGAKRSRTPTIENQGSAKRQRRSGNEEKETKVLLVTERQKEANNRKSSEKKRRSSGRLSNKGATPSSDKKQPLRRRTYDKEEASPGVKDIIGSLKSDMTVQEMKHSLLQSLDKKVKITAMPDDDKPVSQIPRFAAYLAARKKQAADNKKPITPGNKNWAKLHEKQFNKMDSLSKYLEKKKIRQESLASSTKKAKLIAEQTRSAIKSLKECRTPPTSSKKPFVPQATSLAQINTDFTAMKSPAASVKKVTVATPVSSTKENRGMRNSDVQKRKSAVTPFKSGALNTSQLNTSHNTTIGSVMKSASKKAFDLSASLAKPVTWKPHTGKLKPFTVSNLYQVREVRENKGNIKEVKVTSRDTRRNIAKGKRADHRSAAQMKRRGINV